QLTTDTCDFLRGFYRLGLSTYARLVEQAPELLAALTGDREACSQPVGLGGRLRRRGRSVPVAERHPGLPPVLLERAGARLDDLPRLARPVRQHRQRLEVPVRRPGRLGVVLLALLGCDAREATPSRREAPIERAASVSGGDVLYAASSV